MHAERDFIAAVVKVMCDPVAGMDHLGFTQAKRALRLTLAVVPVVGREAAAHRREHRPALGVRMLRVLGPHRPEKHSRVKARGARRCNGDLKLTLERLGRDREIFRYATPVEFARPEKLGELAPSAFSEAVAAFAAPSALGELIHEVTEMTSMADRYLERVIHRLAAGATRVPARYSSVYSSRAGSATPITSRIEASSCSFT